MLLNISRRTGRAGNKGIAYTFLTIDQGPMSGDIMFALEQTNTPIPEQLKMLYDNYVEERKAVCRNPCCCRTYPVICEAIKRNYRCCFFMVRRVSPCESATVSWEKVSSSTRLKRRWRSTARRFRGRHWACRTQTTKTRATWVQRCDRSPCVTLYNLLLLL